MLDAVLNIFPYIFFGVPLLLIFGLFVSGAFSLFFTKNTEKGRDIIIKALTYFLILLALFLVFIVISYLLKGGYIFRPKQEIGFPPSPMGAVPSAPDFIMLKDYSFSGPFPFAEKDQIGEKVIFLILCKKDEDYDIIDLGISDPRDTLSSLKNYECWIENCSLENLFVGIRWLPKDIMDEIRKRFNAIKEDNINSFVCEPKS